VTTEVVSVHDGDSSRASISSCPVIVGDTVPVRVPGLDTPEIRGNSPSALADLSRTGEVSAVF